MPRKIIDSHIHLDLYTEEEQSLILNSMKSNYIEGLINVSMHLQSAKRNLELSNRHQKVYPAFGFHPEQTLPHEQDLEQLFKFIIQHKEDIVAIGEVGLPYYLRKELSELKLEPYIELLEEFILLAKKIDKPIVLHAIYDDARIALDLLEKHSIKKAHFHWFKGDEKTLKHMAENGYYISITHDVLYKHKIEQIAQINTLDLLMVETDGPWPFEGPFKQQMTHPKMIHESIRKIALLKNEAIETVYKQLYENTKEFYLNKRKRET